MEKIFSIEKFTPNYTELLKFKVMGAPTLASEGFDALILSRRRWIAQLGKSAN